MNVKLLRKIQRHILEEPRRLDMWVYRMRTRKEDTTAPPCGTVACIAGWAVEFTSPRTRISTPIFNKARETLGLSRIQANRLFYSTDWPERFRVAYERFLPEAAKCAEITAERIDYFIATKGRE